MTSQDLKNKLHTYIDIIEDETELQLLSDVAEAYVTNPQEVIDLLNAEQQKRLQESIMQADDGKLHSHDDVKKLSKQWLTK